MHEIDREKFGEFLAELRKEKGIKQKELAEKLYVSDKAVSKWETGHSIPDVSLLVPLAEALGVTVTELLECKRREASESIEVNHTDELVKTVIELSEGENSQNRKSKILIYLACLVIAAVEVYGLYCLRESLEWSLAPIMPFVGVSTLFGAYLWLFIKEKLPAYYDENRINVYVDGILHINMPGVYFNNRNWPYIVRALRVWSACGMVILPIIYVVLALILGDALPGAALVIMLVIFFSGLIVPVYVLARKYEYDGNRSSQMRRAPWKIVVAIVGASIVMWLAMWGLLGTVGTFSSGIRVMYTTTAGKYHWSANYEYFNGFTQRKVWVPEKEVGLNLTVTTEEGMMHVEVKDENGEVIFFEENIQPGTYEIKATGRISVKIRCEKHKGGFSIE